MVTRSVKEVVSRSRAGLIGLLTLTIITAGGCRDDAIVVPDSRGPVLYLVLGLKTYSYMTDEDTQHAMLVESGDPTEPFAYVEAEQFEMRRASDGAKFDWRYEARYDEVGTYPGAMLNEANYFLADSTTAAGLGYDALEPGATYEIVIEANGVVMRGRTTTPEAFEVTLVEKDGRRTAVWPSVEGAAAYMVSAYPHPYQMQTDTSWAIPDDVPSDESVHVKAVDENLYRYMTDDQAPRVGIDAGFGVFGAVTTASLSL